MYSVEWTEKGRSHIFSEKLFYLAIFNYNQLRAKSTITDLKIRDTVTGHFFREGDWELN